ncbi:hypothetical protein BOTBODRAFT_530316 [Botryobasidium botryosum FD-172 SS1]|uniref:ER membrane protein complex subunit 7 beta-sandwich domain-containing protein n=1 Tax=Botryobasidium botryosum (strain FD-172 SS1) TaxID=930990 RepID=A0A067M0Z6_BOTB1|nr:hypothetical protein BOTBODRAFT_530316 [Botryobasidium botryosum FD-172 SS1]
MRCFSVGKTISSALMMLQLVGVGATDIQGSIQWNDLCPGIEDLRHHTRVVLDGGLRKAMVAHDGGFIFRDIDPGTYTIDVNAPDHIFPQLRVDVSSQPPPPAPTSPSSEAPDGEPLSPAPPPGPISEVQFQATYRKSYEMPKASFDLIGMFTNPMMLMMLFTGLMMFAMPMLKDSLDPELIKEVEEKQGRMFAAQNRIQEGGVAGLSSLLNMSDSPSAPPKQPTTPARKAGGKKRR